MKLLVPLLFCLLLVGSAALFLCAVFLLWGLPILLLCGSFFGFGLALLTLRVILRSGNDEHGRQDGSLN